MQQEKITAADLLAGQRYKRLAERYETGNVYGVVVEVHGEPQDRIVTVLEWQDPWATVPTSRVRDYHAGVTFTLLPVTEEEYADTVEHAVGRAIVQAADAEMSLAKSSTLLAMLVKVAAEVA